MTEIGTEAEGVMMIGTGGNNSNYTAILHVIFGRERIDYTQIPFGALFYHVTRLAFCLRPYLCHLYSIRNDPPLSRLISERWDGNGNQETAMKCARNAARV